jgi:hypothetical protein
MKKLVLAMLATMFAGSAAYAASVEHGSQSILGAVKAAVNGAAEAEPCRN